MEIQEDGHLLPGYRFCPLDEELILRYLCPKVKGEEVPGEDYLIFNFNLYGDQEPWEIWDMYNERRKNDLRLNKDLYFFSQRKKMTPNGSRMGRTIGSGTWKGVDAAKNVYSSGSVIGFRKRFTYENKESVHQGGWIMFEFKLDPSQVGMLDEKEAQKYVLCILRRNEESQEKRKLGNEDDQERVTTGDEVRNDCPIPDEYKHVKQEEPKNKRRRRVEKHQRMHEIGDDVCGAGPSFSSELQGNEKFWEQCRNPKPCFNNDNVPPTFVDALQGEENYLGKQFFVPCIEDNVQPVPGTNHELPGKSEICGTQCLDPIPLVTPPFAADCELMIAVIGEENYLSRQCPVQCIYCDYVQPFAAAEELSWEENLVRPVPIVAELQGSNSKEKEIASMTTSTDHQHDMNTSKGTSSTDHHQADDPGSNDVDEGLVAVTNGFKYTPWILSFADELLRGERSTIKGRELDYSCSNILISNKP